MVRSILVIVVMCPLVPASALLAQAKPATKEADVPEAVTEIRTYNVDDLVRAGGSGKPSSAAVEMDALLRLLYQLVDTDSWAENGGMVGQAQVLGPLLVIQQTEANHGRITELLQQIRNERGPVQLLNIRAYWLKLDAGEARSMIEASAKAGQSLPVLPEEMLSEKRVYCAAQTTAFSGREVVLKSTREQTYVFDVTPIVGQDSVGYDPEPKQASSGVTLRITPQLTSDGQMLVSLSSLVSELDGITQSAMPAEVGNTTSGPVGGPVRPGLVDRINLTTQEFQASLRMPTGKKILVGGMTLDPAGKSESARQLYLAVEIGVAK